jgi:hypothetical protein
MTITAALGLAVAARPSAGKLSPGNTRGSRQPKVSRDVFNPPSTMSKKTTPQATKQKLERDLATFARLPEKTKELMTLKDDLEKTDGPEQTVISQQIEEGVHQSKP